MNKNQAVCDGIAAQPVLWYAYLMDDEDNDWGSGSYDFDKAIDTAVYVGAERIAVIEEGSDPVCVGEMYVYDSFRVSAVYPDGTTIDNDIVYDTGTDAINAELESAKEWFADREPAYYRISYYRDGRCYKAVEV